MEIKCIYKIWSFANIHPYAHFPAKLLIIEKMTNES